MNVHPGTIGVFDSGLGGLSVVAEIQRLLPDLPLLYVADGRYCPYGVRREDEIRERSLLIGAELVRLGAELLVVACNTASSAALEVLRERLPVPIVGLEPAVKPAAALSTSGRIGVLATPRTSAGSRLARLIETHAAAAEVRVVPAPGLVELVESGQIGGPTVDLALHDLLDPLLDWGADTIVLGCTHYPFLRRPLTRVVGPTVRLVDSGAAVARRTRELLLHGGGLPASGKSLRLLTSGDVRQTEKVGSFLLGRSVSVGRLFV